ncbi:MAG TPA: FAD-dependent oxidoreductase, partial [Pyrinomonadaceae bacterium]|nr:FAD-dependent oxidoreductase [Pyrinomonadaceae bacterium]
MKSAEVVIVGGGIVGASVAYHLAARGCREVLVLERGARPGEGSTGRATGGFRAQFSTAVNIKLSLLAREKLLRFEDETGVDPGFERRGYLFLARRAFELEALHAAQELQHANGLEEARRVSREEVRSLNPAVETSTHAGGVFCPSDGFIRPMEILRGYTEAAARLGVRFEYGRSVEGFCLNGRGRVETLRTKEGDIAAGRVVNAAGAWAGRVARLAGIELPVEPLRRQVAVTSPCDLLPEEMPMTVFVEDGFHFRVQERSVMLLWPDEARAADAFDTSFDGAWLAEVLRRAHERVPCLKSAQVERERCWAGLYEMSPDWHAILGAAPGVENFYLVNGSSGHGVMHAPALGQLLAEMILDGAAATLDARPLRPTR